MTASLVTTDECGEAIKSIQWVMLNMPIDFIIHDKCPIDMLMHVIGLIKRMQTLLDRLPSDIDVANLRHAYEHLSAERVVNQKEFADGLLAPVIERMERKT